MVQEEWVLERKKPTLVGIHHTRIFDDINIRGRPSGIDVGDDDLLQYPPVAREPDEEGGLLGDVWIRWLIPFCYRRQVGSRVRGGCDGKVVFDSEGLCRRCWFILFLVSKGRIWCRSVWVDAICIGVAAAPVRGCEEDEEQRGAGEEYISMP